MKLAGILPLCVVVAMVPRLEAQAEPKSGDEKEICAIVAHLEADEPDSHVSPKLDWENAFGIRYSDLKIRDEFYASVVKPQMKDATDKTLEVRVQFVTQKVAVADAYWHLAGQVYTGQTKPGPDRWGRTTYIFSKESGQWVEVIERVADMRLHYYKHLDGIPKAAPVPAATLQSYVGHYTGGSYDVDVAVEGDHLTMVGAQGKLIVIPTSDTEFLAFYKPNDAAEYLNVKFFSKDGVTSYTVSQAWGDEIGSKQKKP